MDRWFDTRPATCAPALTATPRWSSTWSCGAGPPTCWASVATNSSPAPSPGSFPARNTYSSTSPPTTSCGGRSSGPASWLGSRRALFRELREIEEVDDTLFNLGLSYLLLRAWHDFLDSDDIVGGVDVHPAVDRAARLLHADPDVGSLAELARTVGLSPSHLSRLFTNQVGLSISRFRNQQRLQRFVRLYGNGRRATALAAAHQAGFGSYAQFYRVVRQETGHNPSALRTAAVDEA
jgi:AraC-like DNA-binding protein